MLLNILETHPVYCICIFVQSQTAVGNADDNELATQGFLYSKVVTHLEVLPCRETQHANQSVELHVLLL